MALLNGLVPPVPKLPKSINEVTKRKFWNNSTLFWGIGGALAVYYIYTKFIQKHSVVEDLPQTKTHSDKIILTIAPEGVVPSNAYMMLKGYFADKAGNMVTVPEGYYYIFRDTGLSTGHQFVFAGSLGKNVNRFNVNVPTTMFQDGSYEVIVSDEPVPDNVLGAGEFANPIYQGGTTFKDSSNVIKNHLTGYSPAPVFPSPNRVFPQDMPAQKLSDDLTFI